MRAAGSVVGAQRVELDAVHEGVLVDRACVRGSVTQGLAVGLACSPDVRLGDRRERDELDGVDLDLTRTDPVAPTLPTWGRFHSRTVSVISPARTSARSSRLNSTPRTLSLPDPDRLQVRLDGDGDPALAVGWAQADVRAAALETAVRRASNASFGVGMVRQRVGDAEHHWAPLRVRST